MGPVPDRDSRPWWEALGRHELVLQRCDDCQRLRWPPRAMCGVCGSFAWSWIRSAGRGSVVSWNVTWKAAPQTPVPYVVLLVRLDDQEDIMVPGGYDGPSDGTGV